MAERTQWLRRDLVVVLVYLAAYLGYLCLHQETEWVHWLTLVAIPVALLWLERRRGPGSRSHAELAASLGLRPANRTAGVGLAVVVGLLFCGLQLLSSRTLEHVQGAFRSGRILLLAPAALGLLLLTAATTEEFFFRGILQTRLHAAIGRAWPAVILSTLAFVAFHLPYAYFSPTWASHGDLKQALAESLGQAGITGLALGIVYARSRSNLLAPIILHALIDLLPAMKIVEAGLN